MSSLLKPGLTPTKLLFLLSALAASILLFQWTFFSIGQEDPNANLVEGQPVDPVPEIDDFRLPTIDQYNQMVERPLFIEGRRSPTAIDAEMGEAEAGANGTNQPLTAEQQFQMANLEAKLMGIIITPGGMVAMMLDSKGDYAYLEPNATIDGWRVQQIYEDRVTLNNGIGSQDLYLRKPKPKQAPRTPTPPPSRQVNRDAEQNNQNVRERRNRARSDEPQENESNEDLPPPEENENGMDEEQG